jgi:hypothetical protein
MVRKKHCLLCEKIPFASLSPLLVRHEREVVVVGSVEKFYNNKIIWKIVPATVVAVIFYRNLSPFSMLINHRQILAFF